MKFEQKSASRAEVKHKNGLKTILFRKILGRTHFKHVFRNYGSDMSSSNKRLGIFAGLPWDDQRKRDALVYLLTKQKICMSPCKMFIYFNKKYTKYAAICRPAEMQKIINRVRPAVRE